MKVNGGNLNPPFNQILLTGIELINIPHTDAPNYICFDIRDIPDYYAVGGFTSWTDVLEGW